MRRSGENLGKKREDKKKKRGGKNPTGKRGVWAGMS